MIGRGCAVALVLCAVVGCKGPMAKVEKLRDVLAEDDAAALKESVAGFPLCTKAEPAPGTTRECFKDIGTAFGSKAGFNLKQLDQVAAATVALVVVREGHAEWAPGLEAWQTSMRGAKGPGADALRLAVARQMALVSADVGKAINEEKDATTLLRGIGEAIPGACPTYAALGEGATPAAMPLVMAPDHSPCVQKDLGRQDGPGGTYGRDTWRAAEGAVALWKDTVRALREGVAQMSGKPQAALEAKLAILEGATAKIALKKVPRETGWVPETVEAHGDAGVILQGDGGARAPDLMESGHPATLKKTSPAPGTADSTKASK